MIRYIEAPEVIRKGYDEFALMMAGGITNCRHWQNELVGYLTCENFRGLLMNPRRNHFVMTPETEQEQIEWEWNAFRIADAVSFWFSSETLCPISLLELGKVMTNRHVHLFVGCDPEYGRKRDVMIQLSLERPEIKVVYNLKELSKQIMEWNKGRTHVS